MYTVGIVGCGVIGTRFADTVAGQQEMVLRACCDLDAERRESFAAEYDCTPYADHQALVEDDDVDIVYVGVPPMAHREITEAALSADNHVICEKPIAPDAATGRAIVEAAAASDRTTAINLPFRYTPGFRDLKDCIERGAIGDPRRIELRFRFPRWPREWQDVEWLTSREQGGPLREVGTHFLFGVQELFGGIDKIATEVEYTAPEKYESSIVGHFEADGIPGTIDLLCDHSGEEENVITVVGDESSLSLTEWYKLIEDRNGPNEHVLNERKAETISMLLDEFVAELDGKGGDLVSFEEANRVQSVVDAIFGSEGYPVTLD